MKKSILIGALVVLLLAGFTACSNNTPTSPIMGSQIEGVELVNAPDYLIGLDTIDPAEISLNVVKNDGSKIPYTGTELQLSAPSTLRTSNACSVKYGDLTFYVNIPAYEATGFTYDVTSMKQDKIVATATTISLDGIKTTASYAEGSKTYDGFYYSDNGTITEETEITGVDVSALMTKYDIEYGESIDAVEALIDAWTAAGKTEFVELLEGNVTGTWNITVLENVEITLSNVVLSQIYSYDADGNGTLADTEIYEVFAAGTKNTLEQAAIKVSMTATVDGESQSGDVYYIPDAKTAKVYLEDKNSVAAPSFAYEDGVTIVLQNYTADYEFQSVGAVNATAVVVIADNGTVYAESNAVPLAVTVIKDYPTAFEVPEIKENSSSEPVHESTWEWNEIIDPDDFTFTVDSWASGETGYNDTTKKAPSLSGTWTAKPSRVEQNAPASNYPVTFSYSGDHGVAQPDKTVTATYQMATVDPEA